MKCNYIVQLDFFMLILNMALILSENQFLVGKQRNLDIMFFSIYSGYFDIVIISQQRKRVKRKTILYFCQLDAVINRKTMKQRVCLYFKMTRCFLL